jgi:hypothetical protein
MSCEIWKFEITYGTNTVSMPRHARILSCAFQGQQLMIWAVVVPGNPKVARTIFVSGTGHPHEHDLRGPFVGTAFIGSLVFHVFDHGEKES